MKILRPFCMLAVGASLFCSAQQINPITRAMLNGYNEILQQNPKDYNTLYERAAQYYRISQYDNALNDLTKAIEYTPAKEKDLRLSEFTLLADAAVETGNYELALTAINNALALQPDNYANVYKKGNILLYNKQPQDAYRTFSSMQTMKSRSQEAYFGMAKACIMLENYTEAEDLMKEAEKADPSNYITYCRLGDLFLDMNQPENAATNYLVGFTLSENSDRALNSLISLAEKNYNAVAMALDFAIDKSENKLPVLFLKGNIAEQSGNYSQAVVAFDQLLTYPEARTAGVYLGLAKAQLGLNDLDKAADAIEKSLQLSPSAEAYIVASDIALAKGDNAAALVEAEKAVKAAPNSIDPLLTKSEVQIALSDKDGALTTLNEVVMSAPDNMEGLLLRAYVNQEMASNSKGAIGDFNRIILNDTRTPRDIAIKGIAQAKNGKKLDGDTTVASGLLSNSDPDSLYWAAVYYAQTGDLEKAHEMLEKARYAGFQNQYLLKTSSTPWQTIAPIRHLLK